MFTGSDVGRILDVATQGGDLENRFVAMAQVLQNILGSCITPLEHRANVTIKGDLTVEGNTNFATAVGSNNYAVATGTWVRAAGHGSYVTALPASDPIGTPSGADAITIYLPRYSADKDPNVYSGDILQYVTVDGVNYAVGESFLDQKIGSLKAMTINDTGMNGWTKCDGTGATEDHTDLFVRGHETTYGTTGGADTHGHTGTVTVASTSLSITGAIAQGFADIDDHPDHRHLVQDVFCQSSLDGGAVYYHATTDVIYTEGMIDIGGTTPLTYDHTDVGHTHGLGTLDVTPDPHDHTGTVTIADANNVPSYITVIWYVRTGPSGETS